MVVPQKCHERGRHGYEGGAFARCSPDTSLVGKAPWLGNWGKNILCMSVSDNKVATLEVAIIWSTCIVWLMSEPTDYMYWQGVVEIVTMYQILVAAGMESFTVTCHSSWIHSCSCFLDSRTKLLHTWHNYIGAGQSLIAQARCITGSLEAHRHLASLVVLESPRLWYCHC